MVSFLAAFLFMCFEKSNIATRLLVGLTWAAIAIMIVWCVWMAWEKRPHDVEDAELDAEENVKQQSDERNDTKAPWKWPSLFFRRSSYESDTTVV